MYPQELAEIRHGLVAWDRGHLHKFNINPLQWARLYLNEIHWESLLVGEQGATHYVKGDDPRKPTGVYPVWMADSEPLTTLVDMMENPVGENEEVCNDQTIDASIRPVYGQEHRIVVINTPHGVTGDNKQLIKQLAMLNNYYGDRVKVHLHSNSGSWQTLFSKGFAAASCAPMLGPSSNEIFHPGGGRVSIDRLDSMWAELLGFELGDLKVPRNRLMFNIKSALWAAENFATTLNFATRSSPAKKANPNVKTGGRPTGGNVIARRLPVLRGDKWVCNSCSLSPSCKFFRLGAVCTVPGAEPVKLAEEFDTRDADTIIGGLGRLLGISANRLQTGIQQETDDGELSSEVTKISKHLFSDGVKLAQLLDPGLRPAAAKIQINNLNGQALPANSGTSALISEAIRELEARGIKRADITQELLMSVLPHREEHAVLPKVIEGGTA